MSAPEEWVGARYLQFRDGVEEWLDERPADKHARYLTVTCNIDPETKQLFQHTYTYDRSHWDIPNQCEVKLVVRPPGEGWEEHIRDGIDIGSHEWRRLA